MKNTLKKLILGTALLLLGPELQAQKYYEFSYKGNAGILDSTGAEVVKPEYERSRTSKDGKLWVFYHEIGSDLPALILDKTTGKTNTQYKYVFLDDAIIEDQSYHFLINDDTRFLQNAATEKALKTTDDISSIENIGSRYLIAKYTPKEVPLPKPRPVPKKKSTGIAPRIIVPEPPVIREPYSLYQNDYAVYANRLPLKALLRKKGEAYLALYDTDQMDNAYFENVKKYNSTDFAYLLFKEGDALFLYDKDLKMLRKIAYPKSKQSEREDEIERRFAEAEASKALGKKVYSDFARYPSVGGGPSIGRNSSDGVMAVKKRDAFEVSRSSGVYTLTRTKDEKVCFSTPMKMRFRMDYFEVTLEDKDEKESSFYVDKETGAPLLPQKYVKLLQIKVGS